MPPKRPSSQVSIATNAAHRESQSLQRISAASPAMRDAPASSQLRAASSAAVLAHALALRTGGKNVGAPQRGEVEEPANDGLHVLA
jgi:hypothetical protein